MKIRTWVSLAFLFGFAAWTVPSAAARDGKPNVVVILADDAGFADFGFQGSATCPTPHIDSICDKGVRFTDAHVSASVCSPSRAGLLTGRYQQRFGHEYNLSDPKLGLPAEEKTLANHLKGAGYRTIMLGKWHLGTRDQYHPLERGFDDFYGFLGGSRSYWPAEKTPNLMRDRKLLEKEKFEYLTTDLAAKSCRYIERHKNIPFFMYVAFNAPHTPMHALQSDKNRVKGTDSDNRTTLAAMTISMDDAVGRILQTLRDNGLEENTLLFFTNDNGGAYINASNNFPLRGTKGSPFEGGNRVPFLMQWPKRIPAETIFQHSITTRDIVPTAMAAAGADLTKLDRPLDGVNLLPYITDDGVTTRPHETLYWRKGPRCWAVRHLDWKLVRYQDHPLMLFNMATDAGERTDLAKQHPKIVEDLSARFEEWSGQMAEPLWYQSKTYEFPSEKLQNTTMRYEHPGHLELRRFSPFATEEARHP